MKSLRKKLLFTALATLLLGCSSNEVKKPEALKASDAETREYREAENLYRAHEVALSTKKFQNFLQRHPQIELANGAAYRLGQIFYEQGDYARAAKYFIFIIDSPFASGDYEKAIVSAALCENQLGHYSEALSLLSKFQIKENSDKALGAQALDLSARIKIQMGNNVGALEDLLAASDLRASPVDKQNLQNRAFDLINNKMSEGELAQGLNQSSLARLELTMRFRRGQLLFEKHQWPEARQELSAVVSRFSGTEFAQRAQNEIEIMDSQGKTSSDVVGVVLPLTGKYAQMGYKTLHGIQMAMDIFNQTGGSSIKLAIADSRGESEFAKQAVSQLVAQDHVVAIIGDILGKTSYAVALRCQELAVPCITLSQKQELTSVGDFVFRNALTPNMQIRTLVDVAMKDKHLRRFAILFPNDSYGTEYASIFWDYVLANGGEVTAAQSYEPGETDFRDAVQRLVGTYYADEDRGNELHVRLAAWDKAQTEANAPKSVKDNPPKDLLPPVIDFDGIFIPDVPKSVRQISAMLTYNDVEKIPLLGTNLWNPDIVSFAGPAAENSLFVDDFVNESQSPSVKKFSTQFKSIFGYAPDIFEAQGFDAGLLIRQILKSQSSISRTALRDQLAVVSSSNGSMGPVKMSVQRDVEKSLVPLTVQAGQIVKFETGRDPAK